MCLTIQSFDSHFAGRLYAGIVMMSNNNAVYEREIQMFLIHNIQYFYNYSLLNYLHIITKDNFNFEENKYWSKIKLICVSQIT